MLKAFADSLLSVLYPQECHICKCCVDKRDLGVVCAECWEGTQLYNGKETLCEKCGVFLQESEKPADTFCRHCSDQAYDKAAAAGSYENGLAATVIHLKTVPRLSNYARGLFLGAFERSGFTNTDLLIPVPLSP